MKILGHVLISALALVAGAAQAACEGQPIFSCHFKSGKQVEVCDAGSKINYIFGKSGTTPELALSVPREQATTRQWDGIGRYESYSVTIPNGNVSYTVDAGVDRIERRPAGSLIVEKNQKVIATLECIGKVNHRLLAINLRPSE